MGYKGIIEFLNATRDQPIKIFITIPAMVSLSKSSQAHSLSVEELRELLSRDEVVGLGEAYWSPRVLSDKRILNLFAETLRSGKKIEGHTAGARNEKLMACIASGVSSCHESITAEEVLERLRLGIHVMIREGSIRKELEAISKIKDEKIDFRRLALVTDGIVPNDLVENGYLKPAVQKAINLGFDPVVAIQMATINVAEHFSLDSVVGGIAPGKYADILVIPDLKTIEPEWVISNGKVIAHKGELLAFPRKHIFSDESFKTVSLPRKLKSSDFFIPADKSEVKVRIIDFITDLVTRESQVSLSTSNGLLKTDVSNDILKVAAIDRNIEPGKMAVGFVRGFKIRNGAFASSVAWDTTDIIVVGTNEEDMVAAVNRIVDLGGGIVVCVDGQVEAELPLPIGGVLSEESVEVLAQKENAIQQKMANLGCPFRDAHLSLIILTSPAIPFLRICEDGLIDTKRMERLDLIILE
jgi:adenine deaminase